MPASSGLRYTSGPRAFSTPPAESWIAQRYPVLGLLGKFRIRFCPLVSCTGHWLSFSTVTLCFGCVAQALSRARLKGTSRRMRDIRAPAFTTNGEHNRRCYWVCQTGDVLLLIDRKCVV